MSSHPPDSPSSEASMATSSNGSLGVADFDVEQALAQMEAPELYEYGLKLSSEKKFEDAVRVLGAVVHEEPTHFEAYRARGDCYLELHNYSKAISDFRRATELHPGATTDHQRSVAHYYLHLYAKLESEVPSASEQRCGSTTECAGVSTTAWKHYNLALSAYYLSQYERAIADFTLVLRDFPDFASGYRCRGTAYLHMGDCHRAIEDLLKSSQLETSSSTTFYNLALAHGHLHQFHAAVKYFTQSIALNPNDAATYSNRGIGYKELAQFDSAIADFSTALSLNASSASSHDHRAQCYSELQNHSAALNDYSAAISLQPTPARYQRRASTHFTLGNIKEAVRDIDCAISTTKAAKELGNQYFLRAKFQLDSDLKQAEDDLSKCLEFDPSSTEALYQRAAARHIMKDYAGAEEDLALASSLNGHLSLISNFHAQLTLF